MTVEFIKDGTAIFAQGNVQAIWHWSFLDDKRIKLEPTGNAPLGSGTSVCQYILGPTQLAFSGCPITATMSRI